MESAATLHTIILAGGGSKRFGSPKQLALLDGSPLLLHSIHLAASLPRSSFVVVLGSDASKIAASIAPYSSHIIVNDSWAEGMASSLRAGLSSAPANAAAALVLLADQPRVTEASLGELIRAWRNDPSRIVASQFGEVIGAPCVFPRWCFADLAALHGDAGARILLRKHSATLLAVPHAEAALDIDYPTQLADLNRRRL